MGKEKEVTGGEECAQGRREGRGTPTSIAGGGGCVGKQQDLGTKNHYFQGFHEEVGLGFFPGFFQRKTEEKYNQKKSVVV